MIQYCKNPSKSRLPVFDEGKDNMESYIERFERWAKGRKIPEDSWALELSILLQGKSLDVYTRMGTDKALDYKSLKLALMERFRLTEEGFRQKFRNARPEKGETPSQFIVRISSFIQKWFEIAKVTSLDEAIDICIREQFYRVCPNNLTLYLKERECKNIDTVVHWAEMYVEAHGLHSFSNTGHTLRNDRPYSKQNGQNKYVDKSNQVKPKAIQSNPGSKTRYCYKCKSPDHLAPNCPKRNQNRKSSTGMVMVQSEMSIPTVSQKCDEGIQDHTCVCNCKKSHEVTKVNVGKGCIIKESEVCEDCLSGEQVTLSCGRRVKVLNLAYDLHKNMPVIDGRMKNSGKTVSVLRDTGNSAVVIRSNLVLDSEYTGKKEMVILIDGTARILPTAMVEVNTPFFSGKTEAIVVDNPIYDVIIGNISGARNTCDPDPKWESYAVENETSDSNVTEPKIKSTDSDELDSKVKLDTVYSQAVVTRNQAEKLKQPIKPLKTPSAISEISPTKLGKAQKEDESLSGCWE